MELNSNLQHYIAWFKAHERLVLLLAIGFFGVHFYGKGIDYLTKRDRTQAEIALRQATNAAQKFTDDEQRNKEALAQLAQLQISFNALSVQVSKSMQQRAAQSEQQKHVNDTSNSSELASILSKSIGVGTIKVEPSTIALPDTLQFSLDAAHKVADDESDLVQIKGDVIDLNSKIVACQSVTDKQADTITQLQTTVDDGKTALTKEQESHASDVKTLKNEKRKSWLNGFKWGVITGVVGSLFVHKP
jgi:hypothetical protein